MRQYYLENEYWITIPFYYTRKTHEFTPTLTYPLRKTRVHVTVLEDSDIVRPSDVQNIVRFICRTLDEKYGIIVHAEDNIPKCTLISIIVDTICRVYVGEDSYSDLVESILKILARRYGGIVYASYFTTLYGRPHVCKFESKAYEINVNKPLIQDYHVSSKYIETQGLVLEEEVESSFRHVISWSAAHAIIGLRDNDLVKWREYTLLWAKLVSVYENANRFSVDDSGSVVIFDDLVGTIYVRL